MRLYRQERFVSNRTGNQVFRIPVSLIPDAHVFRKKEKGKVRR